MTPRQRVLTALDHRQPDRVPIEYHFFGTPEMVARLKAHLRCETDEELRRRLGIDIRRVAPVYVGPPLYSDATGRKEDHWGVIREPVSHGSGAYDEIRHYPLAGAETIGDLDGHRWPRIDWFDFTSLHSQIEQANERDDYAIIMGNGNIFETSWYMRGWERMLLDLMANPELVAELLRRVTDWYIAYFTAALTEAKGSIQLAFTADDVAMQHGPLMALDVWRALLKPEHQRLNAVIHSFGAKIVYHCDGAVMDFLEDFVEMGIDALDPLQMNAARMDPAAMKARVGDRLCFHGGVDVQSTLPFGTSESVRARSLELIEVLGRDGGYIFGPAHAIQEDTPVENAVALFDAALEGAAFGG
jgi:uroporphyrinogen decarboxylase